MVKLIGIMKSLSQMNQWLQPVMAMRPDRKDVIGIDTYFLELKIVKRVFLLERMNSWDGVPVQ